MKIELIKERVLVPKRCKSTTHWKNIIIYGGCQVCGRGLAKFEEKKKEGAIKQ